MKEYVKEYVKGRCCTNLDGYGLEKFPDVFFSVPQRGDRVKAESGCSLKVVGITHSTETLRSQEGHMHCVDIEPYLIIELNK